MIKEVRIVLGADLCGCPEPKKFETWLAGDPDGPVLEIRCGGCGTVVRKPVLRLRIGYYVEEA